MSNHTQSIGDRVKLPFQFDVQRIIDEVYQMPMNNFIYYNVIPLRSPAHFVDPSLPTPPSTEDYADGSWTDWLDTQELKSSPYLTKVVDMFKQHTKVTLVRVLRLAAGNIVKEHTDPTLGLEIPKSVIRLTIPIINAPGVEFYLNNEIVPMKPGECWYMRLTDPHRVINNSTEDRINLTIDMIPNDWVQSLIKGS
ncbi:aspartyl/asparaginyl beta-hydroxylase domain-containing protein [Roseivirga thermotolerans]|uniref:aspartyl/asparaginyl beta-hydroxylase domain-containing protein n=1 Tax=Roseivirga thermotolerans TaxID=1758176 RepID=UPI00273EE0FD|nr:aspartyl/asparaginyl beta-hydroxylase domain-containing protein [Roseivirga thermotolerans]